MFPSRVDCGEQASPKPNTMVQNQGEISRALSASIGRVGGRRKLFEKAQGCCRGRREGGLRWSTADHEQSTGAGKIMTISGAIMVDVWV